jgi:D-glycero-D-manno-heptose 1,7-bisphosphate phosphatase
VKAYPARGPDPFVEGNPSDGRAPLRRALFVDRDGTLNPDLHYLKDPSRLELNRGVGTALRLAREHEYLVICVTNQSGIGRGYYTADDVDRIHERLNELLGRHRARVDAFYYCPHLPDADCPCRKPRTLLFEQAQRDWSIDLPTSAVVGDRAIDVLAGEKLGLLSCILRPPGHEAAVDAELVATHASPDIRADTFAAAIGRILARG